MIAGFSPTSAAPVCSPVNSLLAFTASDAKGDEIILYDAEKNLTQILTAGSLPVWSPDGNWLAYLVERESGGTGLAVVSVDGLTHIDLKTTAVGTLPLWIK